MIHTFLNGDKALKDRGIEHLNSYAEDFRSFMNCEDLEDCGEELGSFYDYGLGFDYVELGTFDDMTEDYFRYQLCWGGPSAEVRFHEDWTEFVFMDWFTGVGFDVSGKDWAIWLRDWFDGCGSMNFGDEREKYDYVEELFKLEESEE